MSDSTLSAIFFSRWIVIVTIVLITALLWFGAEVGFRLGLRLFHAKDEARKGQLGGIQGAILGLLALLLGFTFAMAAGGYETRRALVLQEANAIGTTYLRAALLSETHQKPVEDLLRQYVDARLEFFAAGADLARQDAAEKSSAEIQRELWKHAVAAAKETPGPLTVSFISSLNETIDLDATRLHALRTHVPGAVWLLVLIVALTGCWTSGYVAGSSGARSSFTIFMLPLLIAVVITLIIDLDRPRGGLILIKQQPMIDLRQSISDG